MDVHEFGGKGAGLVWLSQNTDLGFDVPEFDVIDTSFYDTFHRQQLSAQLIALLNARATGIHSVGSFKVPKRLEDRCNELAARFVGRDLMVRSSGVVSEDSDRYSGAGRYDSFLVDSRKLNSNTLMDAVLKVYASVFSERAVRYRVENGLGEERMAVVVQEFAPGINGVAMSRLPAKAGVIPIYWSEERGAVVSGSSDTTIYKMHLAEIAGVKGAFETRFANFDIFTHSFNADVVEDFFAPLLLKIRGRYGGDFEIEFAGGLSSGNLNLLQIRPLTNVKDIQITFPNKPAIFIGNYCMGAGEYIGPWVVSMQVQPEWDEPTHYALVASRLEKTLQDQNPFNVPFWRQDEPVKLDYDLLTPNKRAIVVTSGSNEGMHALTIANEKGILCVGGDMDEVHSGVPNLNEANGYDLTFAGARLGYGLVVPPRFNIPLSQVGPYIHIVVDGLEGRVYRATAKEARDFERKMSGGIDYQVSDITSPYSEKDFWYFEFKVVPLTSLVTYNQLCRDFVNFLEMKAKRRFDLEVTPAGNNFTLEDPRAEMEVFDAHFDPENKKEGITFSTGRSTPELFNQGLVRGWFEEFIDRIKAPNYQPQK